jgi:hypothetical protein
MRIPDEDGQPVEAAAALEAANDTSESDDFGKAVKAASDCFNRMGG